MELIGSRFKKIIYVYIHILYVIFTLHDDILIHRSRSHVKYVNIFGFESTLIT